MLRQLFTARFKSLINKFVFILIVNKVTLCHILEGVQYIIKIKTTLRKAIQIQSGLNHGDRNVDYKLKSS